MTIADIRRSLEPYGGFQECIVDDVRWLDYGATVEVDIDYVWTANGALRGPYEPRMVVTLRFHVVQALIVQNGLTEAMTLSPQDIGWGFAEIAKLEVNDEAPGAHSRLPIQFHRAVFWRERASWIEVVFAELHVTSQNVRSKEN